jgi:chromosome segregation ATPase
MWYIHLDDIYKTVSIWKIEVVKEYDSHHHRGRYKKRAWVSLLELLWVSCEDDEAALTHLEKLGRYQKDGTRRSTIRLSQVCRTYEELETELKQELEESIRSHKGSLLRLESDIDHLKKELKRYEENVVVSKRELKLAQTQVESTALILEGLKP